MRKLIVTVLAAFLLATGANAGPLATEDTCACGGTVYLVWTFIYWPNNDMSQPARCERHWSNGTVTDTLCW